MAIFLHDFAGNVFDVNNQAGFLLGYSYEEPLEMSVFDFICSQESSRNSNYPRPDGLIAEDDTALLRIALENLLGSALKFTVGKEKGSHIIR